MLNYKLVQRPNPKDSEAAKKFYATLVSTGTLSLKDLASQISMLSTVSRTDCVAVLTGLLEVMPMELLKGNIIQLGELGSFRTFINSDGVEDEADFRSTNITKAKVRFFAGQELKQEMLTATYSKL